MPLKVTLCYTTPSEENYRKKLQIKVPKKWWRKEAKTLMTWFVKSYNEMVPENKLVESDLQMEDADGRVYPNEAIIEDTFGHRQEIMLCPIEQEKEQESDEESEEIEEPCDDIPKENNKENNKDNNKDNDEDKKKKKC